MSNMEWAPKAEPQSREEVRLAPACPEVVTAAKERGIASVVHFTRIAGLVGILAASAVINRRDLPETDRVRHVYRANAADRRLDENWTDYVNLSVTALNLNLFGPSREWHRDDEWVILAFSPEILGDPGVVFCTTNNIYPAARRGRGPKGFEQMFAPTVRGRYGESNTRDDHRPYQTTDAQAEVLYPFKLPLDHLHTLTVSDGDTYDTVEAALWPFPYKPKIELNPEAFR